MDDANWARLPTRGVAAVGGEDARHFLHNLVTNDIERLVPGSAGHGALLTPQGKVQFDFIICANPDGYLIDLPRDLVADFVRRLTLHRLRAKVTIEERPELEVFVAWGGGQPEGFIADPRLPALGWRRIAPVGTSPTDAGTEVDAAAYAAHRIALGVPEGGADFTYGDAFPHDADMDQLGGVDFRKGCYVGQEVVSRMQHRGTARRRIVQVRGSGLTTGAEIVDGGLPVGTVGSVAGDDGLALIRIDRAAEAIEAGRPLMAGDAAITVVVPDWATFALAAPVES